MPGYPDPASWIIKIIVINLDQQKESYNLIHLLESVKEHLNFLERV